MSLSSMIIWMLTCYIDDKQFQIRIAIISSNFSFNHNEISLSSINISKLFYVDNKVLSERVKFYVDSKTVKFYTVHFFIKKKKKTEQ